MAVFDAAIVALLGLVLGSFTTALVHRASCGFGWIGSGTDKKSSSSRCVSCGHGLRFYDLVPVLSWCALRGRCRYCQKLISHQYPLIELALLVLCTATFVMYGQKYNAPFLFAAMALPFLMALAVIDLREKILPNSLVVALALIGFARFVIFLISHPLFPEFFVLAQFAGEYLLGAAVYGVVSWALGAVVSRLLKKPAMGFGDVKFFAVAGLWLGLSSLTDFMVLSGALGVGLGLLWRLGKREDIFPFGPALITAFYGLLLV